MKHRELAEASVKRMLPIASPEKEVSLFLPRKISEHEEFKVTRYTVRYFHVHFVLQSTASVPIESLIASDASRLESFIGT